MTEHSHIAELIATHQARLHELQLTQATMGAATPAHVLIDIKAAIKSIEELSGAPVEMTVREKYLVDQQTWLRLESELLSLRREVRGMADLFQQLLPSITTIAAYVVAQKEREQQIAAPPRARQPRRVNGE